ncbi:hypothetical protein FRACYDRAFT_182123 [Fragilariopsis cylindrus CCMP1102]|uniref:Bacterial surface antigen (D15) domain-containing protein n=1 Tax=Fragilariopsis cylindrus CCMP1102 TaxID=635003 RepID=A0A1E7FNC8_9STRA|nr:hypothetical protein FRACYDRAFT_182123 [Fragilariopsis cylindrus CCMP1102]|eukprot:OEU19647.1 hypothetical protein FRACYDRAFT_182123 [Fragilariopsis cylindrus CCMP1102]
MSFVQRYGINVLFPANVISKKSDDIYEDEADKKKHKKPIKTDKDLINARLLENGILFEDIQSLPQIQVGVAQAVENLMRTQAFNSVQIELDTNVDDDNNDDNANSTQQQQQQSTEYHTTGNPHKLNVILDEKNWYSLYIGGGVKHEGMEEAMNSSTMLPKAQFETRNVGNSQMAPVTDPGSVYWGIDWTLGLRDIVPRKHTEIPYGTDSSPEIVMQSGSNLIHSIKWEARTNGGWTDNKYQPTVGLDGFCLAELAGPPGDVGFAKAQGGAAIHIPMGELFVSDNNDSTTSASTFLDNISLHATCAGGVLQPISYDGICKGPTISDRFFTGGPMQLRGFLPAGIGPRTKAGGSTTPGGDAMGGNLYYTASLAASVAPPSGMLAEYGVRLFAFANAGTLVGLSPFTNNYNRLQQQQPVTWTQVAQSTRTAAGVGISGGTPMGRVEVTYAWPLRYGPRDARRNFQFGFGLSFG